jgi:hypothetical protein
MTAPGDRKIRGLRDQYGHAATRNSIDRALDQHTGRDGPILRWVYTSPDRHLRRVVVHGGQLDGVTDRDALHLVVAFTIAGQATIARTVAEQARRCAHRCTQGRDCGGCGCPGCGYSAQPGNQPFTRHLPRYGGSLAAFTADLDGLVDEVVLPRQLPLTEALPLWTRAVLLGKAARLRLPAALYARAAGEARRLRPDLYTEGDQP